MSTPIHFLAKFHGKDAIWSVSAIDPEGPKKKAAAMAAGQRAPKTIATQSFLWGIPIASFSNLQHYMHDVFKFDQVDLMETASLNDKLGILTANATTPYIFSTPDLSKTGPLVIEVPAGSIAGMVDDFWQRPVTDLGLPGPDKGKGGKYLITPPGYKEKTPDGYTVFESPTVNVFVAIRIIEPDQAKYEKIKKLFKVYRLADGDSPKPGKYINPPGKYFFGPLVKHQVFKRVSRNFPQFINFTFGITPTRRYHHDRSICIDDFNRLSEVGGRALRAKQNLHGHGSGKLHVDQSDDLFQCFLNHVRVCVADNYVAFAFIAVGCELSF